MSFLFIIFSCKDQEEILKSDLIDNTDLIDESLLKSSIKKDIFWENGYVYYLFNSNVPSNIRVLTRDIMDEWEQKSNNVVSFIERTNQSQFFTIQMVPGTVNSATRSFMNIGESVVNKYFAIAHELGHVLGLSHEHSKPNRDNYINILWGNVPNNDVKAALSIIDFKSHIYSDDFDFNSIMLYECGNYITKKDGTTWNLPNTISYNDANSLIELYSLTNAERNFTPNYLNGDPNFRINYINSGFNLKWNNCLNASKYLVYSKIRNGFYELITETTNNNVTLNFDEGLSHFDYAEFRLVAVSNNNVTSNDDVIAKLKIIGATPQYPFRWYFIDINNTGDAVYVWRLPYGVNIPAPERIVWSVTGNIEIVCNTAYSVQIKAKNLSNQMAATGMLYLKLRDAVNPNKFIQLSQQSITFKPNFDTNYLFPDPCI